MSVAQLEAREVALEAGGGGLWSEAWGRLRRNRGAVIGAALVALVAIAAVFAPLLAPESPTKQDLSLIREGCCPGPSSGNLLGVDDLGRDLLSRILYGARYTLVIGLVSVGVGLSIGLVI